MIKSEQTLRGLYDTINKVNICIMGVANEEKERDRELIYEIMGENFPNLSKEKDIQM